MRGHSILGLRKCDYGEDDPSTFVEQTHIFRPQLPSAYSDMVVSSVDSSGNPIGFLPNKPTIFVYDFDFGGRHDLAATFSDYILQILNDQL